MKKLLLIATIAYAPFANGQEVISSQGETYSNGNGSIDFTVGEVIINTVSDGTNDLTQGFHQTNWSFVGLDDHAIHIEASVFPNPTEDVLNLKISSFEGIHYSMYDAKGKLVLEDEILNELTVLEVSHFAPGQYSIVLEKNETILKSYKLIKHSK